MKMINLTSEAHGIIRAQATALFKATGRQRADGTWDVPLSDEVVSFIEQKKLEGESFSDCLVRIVTIMRQQLQ